MPFAFALTVVLSALAVFQIALSAGAPLGRFAWGGQQAVLSPRLRVGSLLSVAVYALIAVIAWNRLGAVDLFPAPFAVVAMWVVFAYFCVGVVMNAISRSAPERNTMTPVCIVLAVLSLLVALGYGALAMPA